MSRGSTSVAPLATREEEEVMAKSLDELSTAAKQGWSDDARRVYNAASEQFAAELDERVKSRDPQSRPSDDRMGE